MFKPTAPTPPPAESLVIRGDSVEEVIAPEKGSPEELLASAQDLFRRREFSKAEKLFDHLAEKNRYAVPIAEEATFYMAECLFMEGSYPDAADTYTRLLRDFPNTPYREAALKHMFTIANYWLDDTREEMRQASEVSRGQRWCTTPHFLHLAKSKPLLDAEGRACEKLEQVHYMDITGQLGLGDKALFLAGAVKFFNEDYKEADHFFTQLHEYHPNSTLAPKATELAIISKHMSTGGSDYDGRKVAEARLLVDSALRNYPELAAQKDDFLKRQLAGITIQQADKDWKTAEFYRRTGHPGSAYFYYEIVRRRYPGTKYFDMATQRMHELKGEYEKSQQAAVKMPTGMSDGVMPNPNQLGQPKMVPSGPDNTLPPPQPGQPGMLGAPRPLPPLGR